MCVSMTEEKEKCKWRRSNGEAGKDSAEEEYECERERERS